MFTKYGSDAEKPQKEYTEQSEIVHYILPSPMWDHSYKMFNYLEGRRLLPSLAVQHGWYPTVWKGEASVVIRSVSRLDTKLNWFQVRTMAEKSRWKDRYDSPMGKKWDALGVFKNPKTTKAHTPLVICEGPMDALAAVCLKEYEAICTFGVKLNNYQKDHLDHLTIDRTVMILPDRDDLSFTGRIIESLSMAYDIRMVNVEDMPAKDFCELEYHERRSLLEETMK